MATLANKINNEKPGCSAPEPGCMRVGPASAVPALLQMYADEPAEQIVAQVGLDMALLEDPDNCIPFVTVGRLLSLCAQRTELPHFGLLLGQQANPQQLGQLGELATYARPSDQHCAACSCISAPTSAAASRH